MKRLMIIAVIISIMQGGRIIAGEKYDVKYFTIGDVVIEEITTDKATFSKRDGVPAPDELPKPPEIPSQNPPDNIDPSNIGGGIGGVLNDVNGVLDTIDKIINIGQKVFEIIEKNQPVVDIKVNYANAIPYGITHWTQLQGWSRPQTRTYKFTFKNLYGIDVVKVKYQLEYRYNGNYQGKGHFLTGVTIEPISVETLWGYTVSLVAEVPDSTIANVGTHEDPVASMQVQLKWTIHTKIKNTQQKVIFYVDGNGNVEEIANPFRGKKEVLKKVVVDDKVLDGEIKDKINSVKF